MKAASTFAPEHERRHDQAARRKGWRRGYQLSRSLPGSGSHDYQTRIQPLVNRLVAQYPGEEHEAKRQEEVTRQFGPAPPVSGEKILDHIDRIVRRAGADHVALGSDFDGAAMPEGLEDVSQLPRSTEGLLRRGYTETDIRKILGENLLRVLADAERAAAPVRAR